MYWRAPSSVLRVFSILKNKCITELNTIWSTTWIIQWPLVQAIRLKEGSKKLEGWTVKEIKLWWGWFPQNISKINYSVVMAHHENTAITIDPQISKLGWETNYILQKDKYSGCFIFGWLPMWKQPLSNADFSHSSLPLQAASSHNCCVYLNSDSPYLQQPQSLPEKRKNLYLIPSWDEFLSEMGEWTIEQWLNTQSIKRFLTPRRKWRRPVNLEYWCDLCFQTLNNYRLTEPNLGECN